MKFSIMILSLGFVLSAVAAPRARVVTITGTRARMLSDFASKFGATEGGMGHVYANTDAITCVKKIDEADYSKSQIFCDITNEDMTKRISTKKEAEFNDAFGLRELINEVTKAEKVVSATEKKVQVKKVACVGTSVQGHEFDSLEFEAGVSCKIMF